MRFYHIYQTRAEGNLNWFELALSLFLAEGVPGSPTKVQDGATRMGTRFAHERPPSSTPRRELAFHTNNKLGWELVFHTNNKLGWELVFHTNNKLGWELVFHTNNKLGWS